jgi:hypothetical protein
VNCNFHNANQKHYKRGLLVSQRYATNLVRIETFLTFFFFFFLQIKWHENGANLRGLFEKFVDPPYYSESKFCVGAMTVSFSKYLPWKAMHFLQRSTHFSKTCCRPFAASFRRSLGAHFSWLKKPRNCMRRDLNCTADVLIGFHRSSFSKPNTEFNSDLAPCDLWAFPTIKMELRGKKLRSDQRSAARFREVGGAL